jgi:anaerobic glycerol-3-phosphate dehydrogenase
MAFERPWASDCIGERPGGQRCFALADMPPPLAVEAINIPVLDVLREIRSSFRATSFTEIAKMVERVECPTFQRLSQSIMSHRRK